MRIPRRFVMADWEKAALYGEDSGPLFPRTRGSSEEVRGIYSHIPTDKLPDPEQLHPSRQRWFSSDPARRAAQRAELARIYAEYRRYVELRRDIETREPDYRALAKNWALDFAGSTLSGLGLLFILGGMRIGFDFSEYKSLPYKVPVQDSPSLNSATSS